MVMGDYDEVDHVLNSSNEEEARTALLFLAKRMQSPGAALSIITDVKEHNTEDFVVWADARHHQKTPKADFDPLTAARFIYQAAPKSLVKKLFTKDGPFRISRSALMFPRIFQMIRKVENRFNLRPLHDVLIIPYWLNNELLLLTIGFTKVPTKEEVSNIITLGMLYLRKWGGSLIEKSSESKTEEDIVKLSHDELEVIKWTAAGKSMRDVSDITGIKYRTVRYHLENARDKYDYATVQQAVVRAAVDYGLSPTGEM